MRVLALDTATEACSAAVVTDDGEFGVVQEVGRGHAEQILVMVEQVLREAGLRLDMLDGIAASVGPGAFTGVRISVSVAQGLAFGAQLPVVPVTTLEALAVGAIRRTAAGQVLACLDARMGEVYWACFRSDPVRGLLAAAAPAVTAPTAVRVPFDAGFQGVGRGFSAYPALGALPGISLPDGAATALPDARDVAWLGALRLRAGGGIDPADLVPVYLRDKVAQTEAERAAAHRPGAAGGA